MGPILAKVSRVDFRDRRRGESVAVHSTSGQSQMVSAQSQIQLESYSGNPFLFVPWAISRRYLLLAGSWDRFSSRGVDRPPAETTRGSGRAGWSLCIPTPPNNNTSFEIRSEDWE